MIAAWRACASPQSTLVEDLVLRITIDLDCIKLLSDIGEEIGVFVSRTFLVDHRWNGDSLCIRIAEEEEEAEVAVNVKLETTVVLSTIGEWRLLVGTVGLVAEPCHVLIRIFTEGNGRFPTGIVD